MMIIDDSAFLFNHSEKALAFSVSNPSMGTLHSN